MNINDYVLMSISVLKAGMKVDGAIYYKKDGKFVLLCNDIVLTDRTIESFREAALYIGNVYVTKSLYRQVLLESKANEDLVNKNTSFASYENVKDKTKNLHAAISENDTLPQEFTREISNTISTTLDTVDVSTIVESINGIRKIDEYLHTHSVNVALLNGIVGRWKGLDKSSVDSLIKIGLLHDIGKLKVPPHILNKPGKLTEEEFEVIKLHPGYSYEILKNSGEVDEEILLGVLQHHERVNGTGYPNHLTLSQITEFSRITSISDVYDAMVAERVYKRSHSPFEILAWFSEGRYSDLDIYHVNVFLDCMSAELTGKNVILSDGSVAEVVYVNPERFEYPIIKSDKEVIMTNPNLYCVKMHNG